MPCKHILGLKGLQHQAGTVLVVALIVLLLVTILGLAGMRDSIMQERMSGNMLDRNLAFQAAEAALRRGEANPEGGPFIPDTQPNWPPPNWNDQTIWNTRSTPYLGAIDNVAEAPRFFIERRDIALGESVSPDEPPEIATLYRITSRAVGGSDAAVVILQSTFLVQ